MSVPQVYKSNAVCGVCAGDFYNKSRDGTGVEINVSSPKTHANCYQCAMLIKDPVNYLKYEKMPIGKYKGMTYANILNSSDRDVKNYVFFIQRVTDASGIFKRLQLYMSDGLTKYASEK